STSGFSRELPDASVSSNVVRDGETLRTIFSELPIDDTHPSITQNNSFGESGSSLTEKCERTVKKPGCSTRRAPTKLLKGLLGDLHQRFELFDQGVCIVEKLTPQMFQQFHDADSLIEEFEPLMQVPE